MKSGKGKVKEATPWTSTGSFIKKPTTGWLHNDRDLMNGSGITYSVRYLGSCAVLQSMRTLQYAARTAVTREAIVRLGEASGKILHSKKRKVPKHVNKLLGTIDTRWGEDINLTISVDSLQLLKRVNEKEIVNHELSSISFAAGGEGITLDYIGYVAKDPIHDRACHVFDCPEVSHLVLSTIGQAFELRYKLYLNQPTPNALAIPEDFDGDTWGSHLPVHKEEPPDVPDRKKKNPYGDDFAEAYTPPMAKESQFDDHVYDQTSAGKQRNMEFTQDGVYNNPGDILGATGGNIYDNREGGRPKSKAVRQGGGQGEDMIGIMGYSQDGVYDNPSHIGGADPSVYDNRQGMGMRNTSVHQGSAQGDDQIGITTHSENIYSNNPGEERGDNPYDDPHAMLRSKMGYSHAGIYDNPSQIEATGSSVYDNKESLGLEHGKIRQTRGGEGNIGITVHEEHEYVQPPPEVPMGYSTNGCYDNPAQILGQNQPGVYDNKEGLGLKDYRRKVFQEGSGAAGEKIGILTRDESIYSNTKLESADHNPDLIFSQEGVYDNPAQITGSQDQEEGVYDNKSGVLPNKQPSLSHRQPSFDDPMYSSICKNKTTNEQPVTNPSIPLTKQQWFHGEMPRIEAEALLEDDGEFLIRESKGKYVLTAKGQGKCHHLLLINDRGKVKARDKEFKSVPDLVHFFTSTKQPLVIAGTDVFLTHPVLTAFP